MHNIAGYRDIIDLPHRVSETRMPMTIHARAAQFAPFAALMGYEDAIDETARLTEERLELSEVKITLFVPDKLKTGGEYVTVNGHVKHIDECALTVNFTDGRKVPIADIYDINGEIFRDIEE